MGLVTRARAGIGELFEDPDDLAAISEWVRMADRPRQLLYQRFLTFLGLAVLTVFVPAFGPHRFGVAALLVGVHVPLIVVIERRCSPETVDRWHIWHDIAAALIVVSLMPAAWHVTLIVAMMAVVSVAIVVAAWEYLAMAAAFLSGMGLIAVVHDVPGTGVVLLGASLAAGPIGSYSRWRRRQIVQAARRAAFLVESSTAMFFELDTTTGELISLRGQVHHLLGVDPEAFRADAVLDLFHEDDHDEMLRLLVDQHVVTTIRYLHPDGGTRWVRIVAQRGAGPDAHVATGVAFDVTALESSKQELRIRAERDSLTGLANREVLVDRLRDALQTHPSRVAVAIIDLDDFKWVNDTLGHPAGDTLLQQVSERLEGAGGGSVLVSRLGGDEFGLLLEDDDPAASAAALGREVMGLFTDPHLVERVEIRVHASIGFAIGWEGATGRELLRNADIAMYQAKRTRDGVRIHDGSEQALPDARLTTASRLSRSLEDEVELWFQPIVSLHDGRTVAVEGLARWQHPEHGLLLPASFLPTIERAGMSERLDALAVRAAVGFARAATEQGTPIEVAINMTAAGLRSNDIVDELADLTMTGIDLRDLVIEISERDIHEDLAELRPTLDALREVGVGLALDDYGTGFSSLIRLRDLPFTQVKIDRSFVNGLIDDRTDRAIIRSTLDLAADLSLVTVAEGVEDTRTASRLELMRCRRGQGFLFGHPRPAAEVLDHLVAQAAPRAAATPGRVARPTAQSPAVS